MKFGIWFPTSPSTVVSTQLTSDLVAVDVPGNFITVKEWRSISDKIDFCVITTLNYRDLPGKNVDIENFVEEMQRKYIPVYLSFSCLFHKEGGAYTRLKDHENTESRNWICPTDEARISEICGQINTFCSIYKPTGILLWHATFPNEYFCYGCTECMSEERSELDIDKRSGILKDFMQTVVNNIKEKHPEIKIAIGVDVEGEGNIEYKYGVSLKRLEGIVQEIFFWLRSYDEKTLNWAYQLSNEAKKYHITPRFYVAVLNKDQISKVLNWVRRNNSDILFFSPDKNKIDQAVNFFGELKFEKHIQNFFDIGSVVACITSIYAVVPSLTEPNIELSRIEIFSIISTLLFIYADILNRKGKLSSFAQHLSSISYRVTHHKTIRKIRNKVSSKHLDIVSKSNNL